VIPPAEPARVTDVRFDRGAVTFRDGRGVSRHYMGDWKNQQAFRDRLHPLDIALIERCWAVGRLGEREVLADDGTAWTVCLTSDGNVRLTDGSRSVTVLPYDTERFFAGLGCFAQKFSPDQRARVRAIVAGLKDSAADKPREERTGHADQVLTPSAVVTEAHSVTPSGEVKANGTIKTESSPDLTELREALACVDEDYLDRDEIIRRLVSAARRAVK
jgi:hypothetical protein